MYEAIIIDVVELVGSSPNNDQQGSIEYNMLNLSFLSLNELSRTKTIKMKGTMSDNSMMVMVDSGTSHNFISQKWKKMKLQEDPSLCKSQILLKSLFKENKVEFMGMVPQRLPPKHERDHTIPLLPSTIPINVRPYRYAYYQNK
ncbi:hypothetical protein CR513_42540, partial [Mucuna pruriens]